MSKFTIFSLIFKAKSSNKPHEDEVIEAEVQGKAEQRTEPYLTYGEGVVASFDAEIHFEN